MIKKLSTLFTTLNVYSTTAMYHEWLVQLEWCRCHRIFIQIQICTQTCS